MNEAAITSLSAAFGQPFIENAQDKVKVAQIVSENILWKENRPCNPLFLGDGSSAYFVWAAFLERCIQRLHAGFSFEKRVRVYTNNTAVVWRTLIEREASKCIELNVFPGRLDSENQGLFIKEPEKSSETAFQQSTCVLAVTAMDFLLGPCGNGEEPRIMKTAIMKNAKVLIVIADRSKLRKQRNPESAASQDEWTRWVRERNEAGRLYVVTTRSNHVSRTSIPNDYPNAEDKIECENLRGLFGNIGKHAFLCFPPDE